MKKISHLEKEILTTIRYFSFFNYSPTFDEIHTFLKKKTSKRVLEGILSEMVKQSLVSINDLKDNTKYTVGKYTIYNKLRITNDELRIKFQNKIRNPFRMNPQYVIKNHLIREEISLKKIKKVEKYINFLSIFPQIKLIGLSGSVAMLNADEDHDVDLFVITAQNRLWTGRFIALLIAQVLGVRRQRLTSNVKRSSDKVCLNLFFDQSNLTVPEFKKTEYVAHEILQMKPIKQKEGVYLRFIDANKWVFDIFPNAKKINSNFEFLNSKQILNSNFKNSKNFANWNFVRWSLFRILSDWIEFLLKAFQLYFIRKHQTNEIITDSQLWFHPIDFGKRVGRHCGLKRSVKM